MDCTATILKLCARSRSKWSRHKRPPPRPWRGSDRHCCVGSGGLDASSLVRRALIYVCCCRPGEESSELCPEWEDRPVGGGRGRSVEEEGESELLFLKGGAELLLGGAEAWGWGGRVGSGGVRHTELLCQKGSLDHDDTFKFLQIPASHPADE